MVEGWYMLPFASALCAHGGILMHATYEVKIPPKSSTSISASWILDTLNSPSKDVVIVGFRIPEPRILDPRTGKRTKFKLSLIESQKLHFNKISMLLPFRDIEVRMTNISRYHAATNIAIWCVGVEKVIPPLRELIPKLPPKTHLSLIYTFDPKENKIRPCRFYGTFLCRLCSKVFGSCSYKQIKELEAEE